MKTVSKSVLIWYRPEEMYALVTDVLAYPQFLPWCDHTRVLDANDGGMTAEVGIAIGGVWREIEGSLSTLPSERAAEDHTETSDELAARRRAKMIG